MADRHGESCRGLPGVSDCIELNELDVKQPGETLAPKVLRETLLDREWGSSGVWYYNVTGGVSDDTSAGMGRGRGCNGRNDDAR